MSLENGAWNKEDGAMSQSQLNAQGIHDNPVSSYHQAPSHWKNSRNKDTNLILTMPRGRGGPGINSARNILYQKQTQNDLTSEAKLPQEPYI